MQKSIFGKLLFLLLFGIVTSLCYVLLNSTLQNTIWYFMKGVFMGRFLPLGILCSKDFPYYKLYKVDTVFLVARLAIFIMLLFFQNRYIRVFLLTMIVLDFTNFILQLIYEYTSLHHLLIFFSCNSFIASLSKTLFNNFYMLVLLVAIVELLLFLSIKKEYNKKIIEFFTFKKRTKATTVT